MKKDVKFIVFEGAHGSGKTTQAKLLKDFLDKLNISTIYTKEPYLEELKGIINKYLYINDEISSYLLLFLNAADRFIHVKNIIDKLKRGNIVIADRYLLSSCVYQQLQGIPLELIEQINFFCIEPDITFVFEVPLNERKKRLEKINRLRNTIFFKEGNLRLEGKLYKDIFERYKKKWENIFFLNGKKDINNTFEDIITLLE